MTQILDIVWKRLLASSLWELSAMVLSVIYLLLAAREKICCWYAAFAGTAIYLVLFYNAGLLLESILQVFYLVMAVYGWYEWKYRKTDNTGRSISVWRWKTHCILISGTGLVVVILGYIFARYTAARLPYLDAFTTCFAILATFMVPWKKLENWVYWFAIDSASIYLYVSRELYLTALLFCIYLVLIVFGYISWLRDYRSARPHT